MNKNYFLLCLKLSVFFILTSMAMSIPTYVGAQVVSNPSFSVEFPSLAIKSFNTDEYSFTGGETKKFSIQVENISIHPVEFKYKFKLIPVEGAFVESAANGNSLFGESSLSEKISLKGGEQRVIDTTYEIPDFVKDSVVLHFVALNSAGNQIGSKEIFLLSAMGNNSSSPKLDSKETRAINTDSVVSIEKLVLRQDDVSFTVDSLQSGYVLKKDSDLLIETSIGGKIPIDALVSVKLSNMYSSSTLNPVFEGITMEGKKGKSVIVVPHKELTPGLYEIEIKPIDVKKNQLGPARKVIVGVEGLSAVIQAFTLQTKSYPIEKGQKLLVSGSWFPNVQTSIKMMNDYADDGKVNDTQFDIRVKLENEDGDILGEKSLGYVGPEVFAEFESALPAKTVRGTFEVWSGGALISSYQTVLFTEPLLNSDPYKESQKNLYIGIVIGILALLVSSFLIIRRFKRKDSGQSIIMPLILLIFFSTQLIPVTAFAQWTAFPTATTSLQFRYPSGNDSSTTTWAALLSPWAGVVPFSRGTSTNPCVRRNLISATNNNVTQSLPLISDDGRMYRWENKWLKFDYINYTANNVRVWYWMNNQYAGNWPTNPGTTVTGLWARSGFIHQNTLNRIAGIADKINPSWDATSIWERKRPIRLSTGRFNSSDPNSILGTNLNYILATSTLSNLMGWVDARFNMAHGDQYGVSSQYKGILQSFNDRYFSDELSGGIVIPGAIMAMPPEHMNSAGVTFSSSVSQHSARKAYLGTFSSSTMLVHIDAGGWREYNRAYTDYNLSPSDYGDSIAGTYSVFNFLHTLRDEANSNLNAYDCYSSNMIVSTSTYKVIENSHILLSIFNDENGNGVRDDGEKVLSNQSNSPYPAVSGYLNGGNNTYTNFTSINSTTTVPVVSAANEVYPGSYLYHSPSSQIALLRGPYNSTYSTQASAVAYIKSGHQVTSPVFYPYYGQANGNTVNVNTASLSAGDAMNIPYNWARSSGLTALGNVTLDSSGFLNMEMRNTAPVFGHSIPTYSPDSAGKASDLAAQVNQNPVPSEYFDGSIVYWKIPVNSALDTEYKVGIIDGLLPSGWASTTPTQTVTLSGVSNGNELKPVFLGVRYTGSGVCGTATTTLSGPAAFPESNLCSIGQNTAVAPEVQSYTWSCLGVGGGGDTFCSKQKCPGTQYYCEATNACVVDIGACSVAGVCGYADQAEGQTNSGNPPIVPDSQLCYAGTPSLVAGEGLSFLDYTWTCNGLNGGLPSPTCDQPKCSNDLQYCPTLNTCELDCPVTSTSTLIYDASLSPKIVRKRSDQCTFSWKTSASEETPVSCTLNGASLGGPSPDVQRSTLVPVGIHNLSCTNDAQDQSTTTRCQLSPNFIEI